jgi:hypothetical protein
LVLIRVIRVIRGYFLGTEVAKPLAATPLWAQDCQMFVDRILNNASRHSHLGVPLAAVVILLVLLIPLPSVLLDVLISFNLMLSVIVLLSSMYILQPVKFTSFPNLLLLTTLFRLALNVATSRLILTHGEQSLRRVCNWRQLRYWRCHFFDTAGDSISGC